MGILLYVLTGVKMPIPTLNEYVQQVLTTAPVLDDEKRDKITAIFAQAVEA